MVFLFIFLICIENDILQIATTHFKRAHAFDQIYEGTQVWCHDRNGKPYFAPNGWQRYGFVSMKNDENFEQFEERIKNWHVAYHGTKFLNVESIIEKGLVVPGTKLPNGKEVAIQHGSTGCVGPKEKAIYVSPSIDYSANWVYTEPLKIGEKYQYAVFQVSTLSNNLFSQVRVRPGSFRVQGNTLYHKAWPDWNIPYDTLFDSDELEWLINDPENVCVTGLMIKIDSVDPDTAISERFKKNYKIREERRAQTFGDGCWKWNSNQTNNTLSDDDTFFQNYEKKQSDAIEKAFRNGQTHAWLNLIRTAQGDIPYFVDFQKMIQVNCLDNTRIRRIKRVVY